MYFKVDKDMIKIEILPPLPCFMKFQVFYNTNSNMNTLALVATGAIQFSYDKSGILGTEISMLETIFDIFCFCLTEMTFCRMKVGNHQLCLYHYVSRK